MKHVTILFLILLSCSTERNKLPILSYTFSADGSKDFYAIDYSGEFVNQLNKSVTNTTFDNKVVIANFFFTRCPSICPPMRNQLIRVSESMDHDDFLIISHTIDPSHDTHQVLNKYAESTGISADRWQFLTASEEQIKAQAKQYMTNFKPNEDGTDFYHSSYVALVDKERMIRGFYDLLKPKEVALLKEDIESLFN